MRKTARWSVSVVLAAVLIVLAIMTGFALTRHDVVARGGCPALPRPQTVPTVVPAKTLQLALKPDQDLQVQFGRAQNCRSLAVSLTSVVNVRNTKRFRVRIDAFKRSDDARLNQDDITASLIIQGHEARLLVLFGRSGDRLGDPGSYTGSITLDDPRLTTTVTVPITVTLQFVHGLTLLWLLLFAAVPGSWLLWVTQRPTEPADCADEDKQKALNGELLDWVMSIGGVTAVVSGGVAAFGVYIAVYLKDPTWGSSAYQNITLYGSMFSAFFATSGVTHAGVCTFQAQKPATQQDGQAPDGTTTNGGVPISPAGAGSGTEPVETAQKSTEQPQVEPTPPVQKPTQGLASLFEGVPSDEQLKVFATALAGAIAFAAIAARTREENAPAAEVTSSEAQAVDDAIPAAAAAASEPGIAETSEETDEAT